MSELSSNPMRRALRALTHGVYVLSTHHDGADDFLIVSLAMQCSVEPPRIALALSNHARILSPFRQSQRGVLSVLGADQIAAVRRYGTPGGVRHAPIDATRTGDGIIIPPEASFWMELAIHSEQTDADHVLFVANVTGAGVSAAGVTTAEAHIADAHTADAHTADQLPFKPLTLANTGFPYAG